MTRPTIRTALVWTAMVALCIAGTIYEYPHAVDSLWYVRNVFVGLGRNGTPSVPKSVAAHDPEAGAVLRFVLKHRYSDPNTITELRDLVAQYPQNEFFLSELATRLAFGKHADPNEALATADKLLAVNSNNAHAHYLRAWVLFRTPEAEGYAGEILGEFREADRLTEFYLPYSKYKHRVARLAEEAVVPGHEGPRIDLWLYDFLGHRIIDMADWEGMDQESFRQLMALATNVADRVIDDAYDRESLRTGVSLAEELEQTRLRELPLTEDEGWQARRRLAQALALDDLPTPMILDTWPSHSALPLWMAWAFTGLLLLCITLALFAKRRVWPDETHPTPNRGLRSIPGAFMLIGLLVVIVAHRWRSAGVWALALLTFPWYLVWFSWLDYPNRLLHVSIADMDHPEQYPWRSRTAYVLLWFNGTLLLLMSNSEFFSSSHFAGWSQNVGVFAVWSALCLLLWVFTLKPPVSFRRPRYNLAFATVIVWAVALIGFDVFGAQRAYESKIWANPLSVYPNIPAATQETYERFICADASELGRRKTRALPEHFYYFAPEDMEAYFAQRQTDPRRAVSPAQLEARWASYPRDVLPIVRKALADWDTLHEAPPSQP